MFGDVLCYVGSFAYVCNNKSAVLMAYLVQLRRVNIG